MLVHRSGYRPGVEPFACHSRHRYHVVAKDVAAPANQPYDPSLWLVHYGQTDPAHRFPVQRLPVAVETHRALQERRWLESQGVLVRREFMLHDRNRWPAIQIPAPAAPPAATHAAQVQMGMGQHLQHSQFPPQQQQAHLHNPALMRAGAGLGGHYGIPGGPHLGPSPAKRLRPTMGGAFAAAGGPGMPGMPGAHASGPGAPIMAMGPHMAAPHDTTLEEEENTALGDVLDHLTAEEISKMRYTQHHMWLEEVFASPYRAGQLVPLDLGFGLLGELAPLT